MSPKPATPNANAIRCSAEVPSESHFATSVSNDDIDVSRNIMCNNSPSNSKLHNPDDDNNVSVIDISCQNKRALTHIYMVALHYCHCHCGIGDM